MKQNHFRKEVVTYVWGLVAGLVLTLLAYSVAVAGIDAPLTLIVAVLLGLATLQVIAQVLFFLHLDTETKPHWKSQAFIFTVLMIIVIVVGSLWIMANLDYRMGMSGHAMEKYMLRQNKKGF